MSLVETISFERIGLLGSQRGRTVVGALAALGLLVGVAVAAVLLPDDGLRTNLADRSLAPSLHHLFGTDPLGRDMLVRTVKGLAVSLRVGLTAASFAALLAVALGILAALDRRLDAVVAALIDLTLALPHLVLLILVSFAAGGGTRGVVVAIVVSHWPGLARVVRAEVRQVLVADWVVVARGLGRSRFDVAIRHVLPHVVPQALVGAILLFPHAILHEAGMTFLGFGLEPSLPAIGVLLAESMRYLTAGFWWLGVLPGLSLLVMVLTFERVASGVRLVLDPRRAQE
ncbi:MAG: ABC transporter permease [Phyllobacteriaceae bacterium]|nr:ABC transporter permease [Phyllobacteriaceae bacterium]